MSKTTTDHDVIRQWTEKHKGRPAAVKRTHSGEDAGIVRLMFPESSHSENDELVEIPWDEFFRKFEQSKLALVYEEGSRFSKLVRR